MRIIFCLLITLSAPMAFAGEPSVLDRAIKGLFITDESRQYILDLWSSQKRMKLCDLLLMPPTDFSADPQVENELFRYLKRLSLRLGLTPSELAYYRAHGRLPYGSAKIKTVAVESLPQLEPAKVEEPAPPVPEEPAQPEPKKVKTPRPVQARAKRQITKPADEKVFEPSLSPVVSELLAGMQIKTAVEMNRLTVSYLEHLSEFTPRYISEIGTYMRLNHIQLVDNEITRAHDTGRPLKGETDLRGIRIDNLLRAYLGIRGIQTVASLIAFDAERGSDAMDEDLKDVYDILMRTLKNTPGFVSLRIR